MKNTTRTFVAAMAVLAVGCDPGMSIRQVKPSYEATRRNSVTSTQVTVDVKTSHQLIGEIHYAPQVKITNSSDLSITVTTVELTSRGVIYANKPIQPGFYPLVVQPGRTEDLLVWFDLNDAVEKVFQQPAELQVDYRRDNREELVHTSVVGGPLNTSTP